MERKSTKVSMFFITVIWVIFLLGIILHKPYTEKQPQPTEQIKQFEGEVNK